MYIFQGFPLNSSLSPHVESSEHLSLTSIIRSNVCFELDTIFIVVLSSLYFSYLLDFVLTYSVVCDNIPATSKSDAGQSALRVAHGTLSNI